MTATVKINPHYVESCKFKKGVVTYLMDYQYDNNDNIICLSDTAHSQLSKRRNNVIPIIVSNQLLYLLLIRPATRYCPVTLSFPMRSSPIRVEGSYQTSALSLGRQDYQRLNY